VVKGKKRKALMINNLEKYIYKRVFIFRNFIFFSMRRVGEILERIFPPGAKYWGNPLGED